MEDLESGTIPVAVRLEPHFYAGKRAAGYTFLGHRSVGSLRECLAGGVIETRPDARLIPRSYYGVWAAVHRAKNKAGHFAGTRARHYTDRGVEELRELYDRSYSFLALGPENNMSGKDLQQYWQKKLVELETKIV